MKGPIRIYKRPIPSPQCPLSISLSLAHLHFSPHDVGVVDAYADIADCGERGSNGVNRREHRPGLMRRCSSFVLLERSTLDLPEVDDDGDDG